MTPKDLNKLMAMTLFQLLASFAGSVAAMFFWKNVMQGVVLIR